MNVFPSRCIPVTRLAIVFSRAGKEQAPPLVSPPVAESILPRPFAE
jgi:hypothetical protein